MHHLNSVCLYSHDSIQNTVCKHKNILHKTCMMNTMRCEYSNDPLFLMRVYILYTPQSMQSPTEKLAMEPNLKFFWVTQMSCLNNINHLCVSIVHVPNMHSSFIRFWKNWFKNFVTFFFACSIWDLCLHFVELSPYFSWLFGGLVMYFVRMKWIRDWSRITYNFMRICIAMHIVDLTHSKGLLITTKPDDDKW